ncbi:hydrolase [Nitrosarchaeum sp.]|uniref:hydrolase n=1 Tax=Nitrosarchaeum sp. TaxID=2026886 RepID=UPI00247D369B|nr:hydrolase [Nitrosarchaeum sp.]MCV0413050.1 2'-5' RNA ligase family protein [Nitrosarchaeum sp.]
MHAIWFTFSKNDRESLKNIIDELSEKYQAPKFEPHITVYGLTDIEIDKIDKIAKEVILNQNSFFVKKSEILQTEEIWKTVFIELKSNEQMELIHKNFKKYCDNVSKYEFKPHISLIYKILSIEEKIKIINKLDIKNEFQVNKLAIQKFSPDIKKWKIVKEYNLKNNQM